MAVGQYLLTSGIAGPTEQDTLDRLDEFMTGGLGWNRVDIVSDTGSDNDRVWYSEGENPGKYMPLWVRCRANGNDLIFSGYTFWNQSTSTGSDEISNATELQVPNANAADEYVFVGNKDAVYVSIRQNGSGESHLGGFGYWDTLYSASEDPYPLWVTGQNALADTFFDTFRVRSYGYDTNGFLAAASTVSGGSVGFVGRNMDFLVSLATPNPRDGRHLMLKTPFYRERSRTEGDIPGAVSHEIRGELPGLFQISGTNFVTFDRLTASGVSVGDAIPGNEAGEGNFVVSRSDAVNAYSIGPVIDYSPEPPKIDNLELWLHGGAVQRRGGGDQQGGGVSHWIDLSENENSAVQTTEADQPGAGDGPTFNDNPVVLFDDSNHLTGTISAVNDYTAFVVADYNVGTTRQPLFYIRGAVSSNDYIFALEFNNGANNTAEVNVQSDDSPLEEDNERSATLTAGTPYVVSAVVSGSLTSLYVNGDSDGSSTIADTKTTIAGSTTLNYGVGTTLNSSGNPDGTAEHDGTIAEVIVYSRALTNEEHQTIICYLGEKYGITVSGTC